MYVHKYLTFVQNFLCACVKLLNLSGSYKIVSKHATELYVRVNVAFYFS